MSRRSKKKNRREKPASNVAATLSRSRTWENWFWGVLLVVATVLVYQKAWHAGFIWDDDLYVTQNKLLTAPDGLSRIWFSLDSPSQYFPLTYTSFRLEYLLWGPYSPAYHWGNILLHAANALLVWRLLWVLRLPGAWLAAALFALHPVQVESVAWISERKNVLMGLFFLLALLAWVKFVEASSRERGKYYSLALFFYALALFSKTTACTLPAALLLVLWLKKVRIDGRRIAQIAPFLVLGFGMGLVAIWWERYHQGTLDEFYGVGLSERFLVAGRALWFYVGKLLLPTNLAFSYPRWRISATNLFDYVWPLVTVVVVVLIYRMRHRLGRGPIVAALFFVATLSPVLGFLTLYTFRYSFVADHYQYLASIGPLALIAAGITRAGAFLGTGKRFLQGALCAALLISLGGLSWAQCAIYTDLDTLWSATLARNPESWMAHNNVGISLARQGRTQDAIDHFNRALELNPHHDEADYNLANALLRLNREDEAIPHYEASLKINPRNTRAHFNLAAVLARKGQLEEAMVHYNKVLEVYPNDPVVHRNLEKILRQMGRTEEADAHLRKAEEGQRRPR